MNSVNFVKGQGGLGRVLPGEDHFSGLLMYVPTANYSKRLKRYNSLNEAIADGITNADGTETKASNGNIDFTLVGGINKVWTVKVDDVLLCIYTEVTGLTTTTLATAIYNAINAGTATHGYTATNGTATEVALVAPVGVGSSINTGSHLTAVCSSTGTATVVQFGVVTPGIYAIYKPLFYHIAEFFRLNPNGALFVMTVSKDTVEANFNEIVTLQTFAEGKIRQLGIYQPYTYSYLHVTKIQEKATTLEGDNKPLSVLYAADLMAISAYTTLATNSPRSLAAKNVSVVIGEDGASTGATLANEKRYSITCLGAALGTVSLAAVNENIGWVGKFNIASVELDTPALAFIDNTAGRLIKNYTTAALDALNANGYIFLVKHLGVSGSYFNDSHTAIPATSDYAYIENNRTIDKAIRGIRTYLVPEINSPVKVDAVSGKLDMNRVKYLEAQGSIALDQMMRNGELSGYQVTIDPDQNVLGTSTINVTVQLVPVGVARTITVTVGFVTKLT